MKTAVIFIGIPASGKSTFYAERFAHTHVRINLDTLRTRYQEKLLLDSCIQGGKSFVVDNTNPTANDRNRYIPKAKEAGYSIIGYFFQSVLSDCIARNSLREGKARIRESGIARIASNLEMPEKSEGFDELYFVSMGEDGFNVEAWKDETQ